MKKKPKFNGAQWREHTVIVKKGHPTVKGPLSARMVARYHGSSGMDVVENSGSYRVISRPQRCFQAFRSQKQGKWVTVVWGKLRKGAQRRSSCQ
jgi:hypothetical protein